MDTNGRQTDGSPTEGLRDDNVVRLPRDWLGPREDLIPFGVSADEPSGAVSTPPNADDFWGESSASVQDAVQASAFASGDEMRRRAGSAIQTRRRPLSVLVVSAAILAAAAALFATGAPKSSVRRRRSTMASITPSAAPYHLVEPMSGRALERALRQQTRARVQRAPRSRRSTGRPIHHEASTAIVQPVQYTSAPPPTTAPSQPTSSTETSSSSSPQAAAAGSGSNTQPSAGNQPALGADGALAPGSSPDG